VRQVRRDLDADVDAAQDHLASLRVGQAPVAQGQRLDRGGGRGAREEPGEDEQDDQRHAGHATIRTTER
jgi:hypothetical protein